MTFERLCALYRDRDIRQRVLCFLLARTMREHYLPRLTEGFYRKAPLFERLAR